VYDSFFLRMSDSSKIFLKRDEDVLLFCFNIIWQEGNVCTTVVFLERMKRKNKTIRFFILDC